MEFVVRLKGKQKDILEDFVKKGYFNTKSEVIRAGILELNNKYNKEKPSLEEVELVNKAIKHEMKKIKQGKTKLRSEDEFLEKYPHLKNIK